MNGAELQEFIDRYNAAWNAHDVDAIVAMHTVDSVFENHTTGDVNVGKDAIAKAITGIFGVFPDLSFEARSQYIRDDLVVQEWTARGTHEGPMNRSGIRISSGCPIISRSAIRRPLSAAARSIISRNSGFVR